MHADDIRDYEGPPCEMCQRSMFVGTCRHRPMRMPKLDGPEPTLSPEDRAALDALTCPACNLPGMKDGACLFQELHQSKERSPK